MKIENPIKILVKRRAALGDVVMTTGVVRELRKAHGTTATIDICTDFIDVYRRNPHVDNVYKDMPIGKHYDVIYDLDNSYEFNPSNHFVDTYFHRVFGLNHGRDQSMELFPTPEDRARVEQDIAENIGDNFIVIHMRNWYWANKNIQPQTWFQILEGVFTQTVDTKVVLVGGPNDISINDHPLIVNRLGAYNLQEEHVLMSRARLFIGVDSGPFHIAGTSACPILALLSHVRPEYILPYRDGELGKNCTTIQASVPCVGCHERQVRPVSQLICEQNQTYPCNTDWDVDAIVQVILNHVK
jgi:heptosyltransferase-3